MTATSPASLPGPPSSRPTARGVAAGAAWGGALLYLVFLTLLLGGAPRASAAVQALGVVLAAALLVGLLGRSPLSVLALTLTGSVLALAVSSDFAPGRFLSFLAADVALGFVVASRSWRSATAGALLSLLVQSAAVGGFAHRPDDMTATGVVALLAMTVSCTVGLLARERRQHAVSLRSKEVTEAVTAERLRIARELHDMVAHSIGIIAIQAGVGRRVIDTQPAEARNALEAIETIGRETLAGLRRTLVALRQADPGAGRQQEPLAPTPDLAGLERLVAMTADAGVRVELHRRGEQRRLPPDIELSAYRIVQEAVTNVVRHAAVGHCWVTIGYGVEELHVQVDDEGRGAPDGPGDTGFGITGMRERVALLQGRFSAGPRPGGGFRVTASLPLPPLHEGAGAPEEAR